MRGLLRNIFYKAYQIELASADGKQKHISFKRGWFVWNIIHLSYKQAENKTEEEEKVWSVVNITRIQ